MSRPALIRCDSGCLSASIGLALYRLHRCTASAAAQALHRHEVMQDELDCQRPTWSGRSVFLDDGDLFSLSSCVCCVPEYGRPPLPCLPCLILLLQGQLRGATCRGYLAQSWALACWWSEGRCFDQGLCRRWRRRVRRLGTWVLGRKRGALLAFRFAEGQFRLDPSETDALGHFDMGTGRPTTTLSNADRHPLGS